MKNIDVNVLLCKYAQEPEIFRVKKRNIYIFQLQTNWTFDLQNITLTCFWNGTEIF